MIRTLSIAALASLAMLAGAAAQDKVDPAKLAEFMKATVKSAPPQWQARIVQDDTQRICSETRNNPSTAQFEDIRKRETAAVEYPADGNVLGDWKKGERVAQVGTGHQFSDGPNAVVGGNCYACHQMDKKEVSYGTLGPSLLEYGKIRKFSAEEAKASYAKIYDSHSVTPCSNMPRFGANKFLTMEQIKDVNAYLMSPDSPVNK